MLVDCVSVRPSVCCMSISLFFVCNNLSKCQWIFTKLGCAVIFRKSGFGSLMGKFLTELSAFNTIMAGYYHFTFLFHLEFLFFKASIHNSPLHFFSDSFKMCRFSCCIFDLIIFDRVTDLLNLEFPFAELVSAAPAHFLTDSFGILQVLLLSYECRPQWLSWMPVRLETRRLRVRPPPRSSTFFRGDSSCNIFYGHSLPFVDSRRAVVSFWRKNMHNTG